MEKSTFSPLYEVLRARLVAMREKADMTQRELAQKLGRERSFVSRMEQGERRLDVLEFYWVLKALGQDAAKVAAEIMRAFADLEDSGAGRRRRR
jgi:transcriptional regulator with XRE-family HTH domain